MINRRSFYDKRAALRLRDRYYQKFLTRYCSLLIPPGMRVIEVSCGLGDLLASLRPAQGLGIDFSEAMIKLARSRHPRLRFQVADANDFPGGSAGEVLDLPGGANAAYSARFGRLDRNPSPRT